MLAVQPIFTAPAPETSLFEKAVCLTLTMGRFGNTRKAPIANITVQADKTRLRLSKQLLVSPELDKIESYDNSVRTWTQSRCLPMPAVFKGNYVLPLGAVEEVNERLERAEKQERPILVEDFCRTYPDAAEQARVDLGDLFDSANYPGLGRVRSMFYLDYRYFNLSTPSRLRDFSVSLFRDQRDRAARLWQETIEEGQGYLRNLLLETVKHARERLEAGTDGKPRVFRNSMVKNINDFIDTFQIRNIADDRELAGLVEEMRRLASGVGAEDLRSNDKLRQAWAGELTRIERSLASMVIDKPTRRITFDD